MSLGQQIKKYRQALGLTLDQLAELSTVQPGTISALTVRNSVKSSYAPTLAKNGFGLSLEQLLDTETNWIAQCFDHVNANRPSGWAPTSTLIHQAAAARKVEFVAALTHDEIKHHATKTTQVKWPFKLVSYSRLLDLRKELGQKLADEAIIDIDKQIEIVVMKWEREIAAHRPAKQKSA